MISVTNVANKFLFDCEKYISGKSRKHKLSLLNNMKKEKHSGFQFEIFGLAINIFDNLYFLFS